MEITRVGDFTLGWGESLVWDDRRGRLYFVDCAAQTLHWLETGADELHTQPLPSMGAGVVPTEDGSLVVALEEGLFVVDPDAGTTTLLSRYPSGMGGRANDGCADLAGHLITGKLNLGPAEGSAWWFSTGQGWRLLDERISNTNGPAVGVIDGTMTLIIGDTAANYYSYPYDPEAGTVGERAIFGDVTDLAGLPDGATLDADNRLWCALVQGGQLARFTTGQLDATYPLPVANPTDVTFGGPELDRLYVVSIGIGAEAGSLDGALLAIDGLGCTGRSEPRFRL
jgi:sugar lactone lactonase YvrE